MFQHLGPFSSWSKGTWPGAPRAVLRWLCLLTQMDKELVQAGA